MTSISCNGNETKTLHLDPAGDAVLVVQKSAEQPPRRFLISSTTLSLASPYFKTLFGPSFKEGKETRQGTCPDINLEEDDPAAMEILLSILHFRNLDEYIYLRPKTIAEVAIASDKYDCVGALTPWACQWFHDVGELDCSEEYGLLLTAAFLLRSEEYFRAISVTAVRHMERGFLKTWSKHEIINRLPTDVKRESDYSLHCGFWCCINIWMFNFKSDAIANLMLSTLDSIQDRLYSGAETLRRNNLWFPCDQATDNCNYCTAPYRVAEYIWLLRKDNLDLSVSGLRSSSISVILDRVKRASQSQTHRCDGADKCPLLKQLQGLPGLWNDVIENTKGVSIEALLIKK